MKASLAEVKRRSSEERFFSYEGFRDRLFVPPAIYLTWVFVRLGWTGNSISFLSGAVGVSGGVLMASGDPRVVLAGSFGYMLFYLLDYVDGGVARFRGDSGVSGQYADWVMHVVVAVGFAGGLFAGALGTTGLWIVPFGILGIIAAALSFDRFSFGWFAICMHYQQQRAKGVVVEPPAVDVRDKVPAGYRIARNLSTALFHENFAIYLLPLFAAAHYLLHGEPFDFRVGLTLLSGLLYFPVMAFEVWHTARSGRVENAYRKLFFDTRPPQLPADHFLG